MTHLSTRQTVRTDRRGNQSADPLVACAMGQPEQALPLLTRLGNYELVRLLAQGGMADIYLARQVGIGQFERYVAVKVLNAQRARDPESCALFLDEARLVGMLHRGTLASVRADRA